MILKQRHHLAYASFFWLAKIYSSGSGRIGLARDHPSWLTAVYKDSEQESKVD